MKILYIGNERSDAQAVATALHGVEQNVKVSWASGLEHAVRWLDENRDLEALLVEAPIDTGSWPSVLKHARGLPSHPAVVVIVPEGTGPPFDSLPEADDYIARSHSLLRDLPIVVTRAVTRARGYQQLEHALSGLAETPQSQPDGLLDPERAARADLEQTLAVATAALQDAERRHLAAMTAAGEQLADRQAQYEIGMARAAATWEMVDEQLRAAALEVERARQDQASAAADVDRLSRRESELFSQLTESAERQREFQEQIAQDVEKRRNVEDLLAQAVSARDEAEKRHASAMADAATQSRELEATLRLTRMELESKAADVERLTTRETDLSSTLADVTTSRNDLERRLAATDAAFEDAVTRATRERLAASKKAAEREAELDGQIRQERATRATLEQAIADADAALRNAHQRHDAAMATAANELAERQAHFDRELSQTAADRDHLTQRLSDVEATLDQVRHDHQLAAADVERLTQREGDLTSQLADLQAARDTLELRLAESASTIADADERSARERAAAADCQADLEARLAREFATRSTLEQTLAEMRSAALEAERSFREEADALRARGLEQEAHFDVQFAQERLEHESRLADMQGSHRTLALERDALQQSLSTIQEQSARLQQTLTATTQELEAAKRRQEVLQKEADQVPRLHEQLDESRAESHRLFEQAGLAMFRCTPDGALTHANRACASLVGRRTVDELRGAHFAEDVFEAPTVLSWLIERCLSTRAKESIETTWRRRDTGRLFVRLSARLAASDVIEVVAEDLTRLHALQERLGQSHRMEAVGRFASEVAVTCGNLLSDMHEKGREWLMRASGDADSQRQAALLLDEVMRAAGLLRQLAECGDEQARTPTLVDLNTLIHDLKPVLKRVAGGDVDVQLRDAGSPLNVDVGTERVERLLVNLASYGRERMPHGGRLKIELGTTVVDPHFAAKYPNLRPGLHALITATEIRRAERADGLLQRLGGATTRSSHGKVATPGVDFATLQGLVSECGGHLWMKVQPRGDMVAKIRLPLVSSDDQALPRPVATRGGRERPTTRLVLS